MSDRTELLAIARQFAKALDTCDYSRAAELLADECRYVRPGKDVLTRADAIVASYQESDEKARRDFDFVEYRSETVATESSGVQLTFFDELRRGSSTHTFRCRQIVYFDEKFKIARIELVELPGERERLKQFCDACSASLR